METEKRCPKIRAEKASAALGGGKGEGIQTQIKLVRIFKRHPTKSVAFSSKFAPNSPRNINKPAATRPRRLRPPPRAAPPRGGPLHAAPPLRVVLLVYYAAARGTCLSSSSASKPPRSPRGRRHRHRHRHRHRRALSGGGARELVAEAGGRGERPSPPARALPPPRPSFRLD